MVLVDTSVWIEVFRAKNALDIETIVPLEDVVLCLPVYQEILQGFRDEKAYQRAREALDAMPIVESPLRRALYQDAAQIFRSCRRAGLTIRSGVDCLIAACALEHRLPVLHRDRDFDLIARVSPLDAQSI